MMEEKMKSGVCPCPHHKVVPLLVILFAFAFLLKALSVLTAESVDIIWPILVGAAGIMKLNKNKCKCC